MNEGIEIQTQVNNGHFLISAKGDLILTNADTLQTRIDQAIKDGMVTITLDLSQVDYIDSFGIGVVVKTKSEIELKKIVLK